MQYAVYDDAVEFLFIVLTELFSIGTHGIKRYDEVAVDGVVVTIVEGYDVSIVVVLQKLAVDFEYFLIVAEEIAYLSHTHTVALCHALYPF